MRATSIRTIIGSLALVLSATVPSAFGQRAIPTAGLLVHLDGIDPLNSATTWHDSSGNGLDGGASNTIFDAGVGYTFDGSTSWVELSGQGAVVNGGDNFAFSAREAIPVAPISGRHALLGGADDSFCNEFYFDYVSLGSPITYFTQRFTPSYASGAISTSSAGLGTSEHQIGLTWVADSPGSITGTARLYVDGSFVTQVTGFSKMDDTAWYKDNVTTIGASLAGPGTLDSAFQGNINEVAVYSNFSGTPDALMSGIFNAVAVPEPSVLTLVAFGTLGAWAKIRRHRGGGGRA